MLPFQNMDHPVEIEVSKNPPLKRMPAIMKGFNRIFLLNLFAWIIFIGLAILTAPKNYYITNTEMKERKFRQLSEAICGAPTIFGEHCRAPCWNGALYREPKFISKPECEYFNQSTLLIYAYSALDHTEERAALRESFDKEFDNTAITARLVFIVGIAKNSSLNSNIQIESSTNNDIIQIDIEDSYVNLGFKALGIFKWIKECGGNASELIAKIDDDDFDIFPTVKQYVAGLIEQDYRLLNEIMCVHTLHNAVAHEPKYKKTWETSIGQYFATVFPSYCQGDHGMFMSRRTALMLYEAAEDRRIFHIDDIYVSGLLRQRACIKIVDGNGPIMFLVNVIYKIATFIASLHMNDVIDISELDYVRRSLLFNDNDNDTVFIGS